MMAEELERARQAEPPFWPPEARYLLRDLAVALLWAPLVSAIGIAWILCLGLRFRAGFATAPALHDSWQNAPERGQTAPTSS